MSDEKQSADQERGGQEQGQQPSDQTPAPLTDPEVNPVGAVINIFTGGKR